MVNTGKDLWIKDTKESFFKSGSIYVNGIVNKIRKHISPDFSPERSLDIGCGVGRLLIPISKISTEAVGVDVSASMLAEAEKNLVKFSIENTQLIESKDCANFQKHTFDFIHSYIVFQHIPVNHGMIIFENVLGALKPGGVGVLHFTYFNPSLHGFKGIIRNNLPFLRSIKKILTGESVEPEMQMNEYKLIELIEALSEKGVSELYVDITDHSGIKGVIIYFQKCGV